ncbi:MAG: succinylglutamate desuccinylase [Alphaproteobacteria bacterium]|nr:succinylglutamate desuccinylase [Alphaproteobacteria bacterium]
MARELKREFESVPDNPYPIELTAPDIAPYRAGNTGVDYVTVFESGQAGPDVVLVALMHGNEICGAVALDRLLREGPRPSRGRLTLAFANHAAFARFDPRDPTGSRFVDQDLNRVWSPAILDGPAQSVELARARELRPVFDRADYLLDIHSMQHGTPALMLAGLLEKGRALALRVAYPAHIMCDAGHAAGSRLRDYGGFGDPASPKNALLVECGQHWARVSADVAIETMFRFLLALAVIDPATARQHLSADPPAPKVIEVTEAVTAESDRFAFAAPYRGMEVIPRAGTVLGHDGERPIVTPYDSCVLIMPSRRLVRGQTAVRLGRYVD